MFGLTKKNVRIKHFCIVGMLITIENLNFEQRDPTSNQQYKE